MLKKKNIERKWKRSLIYTQCGKKVEEELTYERFAKELTLGFLEFSFVYNNTTIDIAFHHENERKIYELNINGYNEYATHQNFDSPQELLEYGRVDGKTFKEIWENLKN